MVRYNGNQGGLDIRTSSNNIVLSDGDGNPRGIFDGSGNFLVGATALTPGNGNTDTGHLLKNDGRLFVSSASNSQFNRNSAGNIVTFRQSGNSVGSIGTDGTNVYIGSGDTTLKMDQASDGIFPRGTDGVQRDGAIQLGSAGNRFSDLYLSGGVYLGGTGSANKLDDYEEGTWVATAVNGCTGLTSSTTNNRYTKVGNVVHVIGEIGSFTGTDAGNLEIGGLPFAIGNGMESSFSVLYTNINLDSGYTQAVGYAFPNASKFRLYEVGDSVSYNPIRGDQIASGSFIFQMTYHT